MRALNSRRLQLSTFHLFPRFLFYLLLALFVVHGGRARSVVHDEEGPVQPQGKLSAVETQADVEVTPSKTEDNSAPEQLVGKGYLISHYESYEDEKIKHQEPRAASDLELLVNPPSPKDSSANFEEPSGEKEGAKKVDILETPLAGDVKTGVGAERGEALNQEDEEASVAKKRRRNDLAVVSVSQVQDTEGIPVEQVEDVKDEGIRRFDVRINAEDTAPSQEKIGDVGSSDSGGLKSVIDSWKIKTEESKTVVHEQKEPEKAVDESYIQYVEEQKEEIPNYFRKSAPIEADDQSKDTEEPGLGEGSGAEKDESNENREYRYVFDTSSKSRRKSSTVYLNAEEKKIPSGEQESIVDGQIKKLISIRDDALGAQKSDKLEEAKVLISKPEVGLDEVTITQENAQSKSSSKVKDITLINSRQLLGNGSILKKWRDQAVNFQEQIRNKTVLLRLKEQASEILPQIPKFTEDQLLVILEQIVLSKRSEYANDSYASNVKDLGLTDKQLQIIKCAEQLVAVRERQSFVTNLAQCIRGLNALNCIKIFVWPILVDNLPASLTQNLDNFPIEINVVDLFQGNKQKTGRAQNLHHVRLISPETVLYNILQDAVDSYPKDETLVSYVDPNNETLKELLSSNQLSILQMAEQLLPLALRPEYSDSMFSCVRRFEYFSCVKYFAWPLVKQYFPALPAFPDYQNWYPLIDLYPQYPIVPFPSFSGDDGELPEVVDADGTRSRRPRPEAVIIQVLQDTLKEQPRISTSSSYLDQSTDAYATLIPQDQLLTINMAEQLLPVPMRPEFVQKTVKCMQEYNYLTCIKYSTWPTVKQFIPSLPDISGLLPDFQVPGLSDIWNYVPSLPSFGDLSSYWPIGASEPIPEQQAPTQSTYIVLKSRSEILQSSNDLEAKMMDILLKVRNSLQKSTEIPPFIITGNTITFPMLTKTQLDIVRHAECLIPPDARSVLITDILIYLQRNNNFIDCARYVIWPTIARYVTDFPKFPSLDEKQESLNSANLQRLVERSENRSVPSTPVQTNRPQGKTSCPMCHRYPMWPTLSHNTLHITNSNATSNATNVSRASLAPPQQNATEPSPNPGSHLLSEISIKTGLQKDATAITTDTRFASINNLPQTEQPETAILNILRRVQLQSPYLTRSVVPSATKSAPFWTFINDQQVSIVKLADSLLPPSVRTEYINKMIECLRKNTFLTCNRDITWPTLSQYIPWLPNLPNFNATSNATNSTSPAPPQQNATEPSPNPGSRLLAETDVKTGLHGDATVTITDTRFVPIFNNLPETEQPETVILNILRSVQLQTFNPNITTVVPEIKTQLLFEFLTDQQISIMKLTDSLLPPGIRTEYINKMVACLRVNNFVVCTRDVTWPTLLQYIPWLPSLPNFGIESNPANNGPSPAPPSQNVPESSPNSDSGPLSETNVKTGLHGDTTVTITDTRFFPIYNDLPETVIHNILKAVQLSIPNLPGSQMPTRMQEFSNYLTEQQMQIMQIVASLIPNPISRDFTDRFVSCLREKVFLQCTRDVTWPTIAQSYPWLPSFPNFGGLQNAPRIRFQVLVGEKPPVSDLEGQTPQNNSNQKSQGVLSQEIEEKIENILANTLAKSSQKVGPSYLDTSNLDLSYLTKRQLNIVRLVENGLPESIRAEYIARMLECTKANYFVLCTQSISWPTLKQIIPSLPNFPDINDGLPNLPGNVQVIPGISQLPGGLPQIPQLPGELPQLPTFPQRGGYSEQKSSIPQLISRPRNQGSPSITPSVDNEGAVPGYAGQPAGILIDISKEKVQLPDELLRQGNVPNSRPSLQANSRRRRSADLLDTYYEINEEFNSSSPPSESFPNITESRYLEILIKLKMKLRTVSEASSQKQYFVDTLNSTIRDNLTADQYEILKAVEDLPSGKGLVQQVIQCITGLSFIRCLGIFIWPLITNNLFPSFSGLGIFGRSLEMENKVQEYFGVSVDDFENEMLTRKKCLEQCFLDWYKKLVEDEFQTKLGFVKIKGYGNGELEISFSGVREGRGAKLKDNKNLPSILTIISDIMEEVLDQRPEGEKSKKEKEKKERSIDVSRESDIQFLKDSEEYVDIKRSMNDDEIITKFLDKIKSNDSEAADDEVKYFGLEDAYNAFGVLFGAPMHSRLAHKLQNFDHQLGPMGENNPEENKAVDIVPLTSEDKPDELKVLSLKSEVTYDLEKESSIKQEEKQRQRQAKHFFKSLLEKPKEYLKDFDVKEFKDIKDNKIIDEQREKTEKSSVIIKLPRLDDKVAMTKMKGTLLHVARDMKTKMMQMMPGVGLIVSFLIQMALAHARTAATVAGIISNMAMGSAVIGMIRDTFFGSNKDPQIKYVYDNDKMEPGVSWPAYESNFHHHGGQ